MLIQVLVVNSNNMYHLKLKCILLNFFHIVETAPSLGMVFQFLSRGAPSINCLISPPNMNTALMLVESVKQYQLPTENCVLTRELSPQFDKLCQRKATQKSANYERRFLMCSHRKLGCCTSTHILIEAILSTAFKSFTF